MGSKLASYSVVANARARKECAILIHSIRAFSDLPIYVYCDARTASYVRQWGFINLEVSVSLTDEKLSLKKKLTSLVVKQNDFHNTEIIACKMDCIKWACEEAGNTLFIDADLIFVKDPASSICDFSSVMLSPHYPFANAVKDNRKYGVFNAGYLWAGCKEVADVWLEIYLRRSTFYEQQGMVHFFEYFNTKLFDQRHNIGFWRYEKCWKDGKVYLGDNNIDYENAISFHAHLLPETYCQADSGLKMGYDVVREEISKKIPEAVTEFTERL